MKHGPCKLVLYSGTNKEKAFSILSGQFPAITWWNNSLEVAACYTDKNGKWLYMLVLEVTLNIQKFHLSRYKSYYRKDYKGFGVKKIKYGNSFSISSEILLLNRSNISLLKLTTASLNCLLN